MWSRPSKHIPGAAVLAAALLFLLAGSRPGRAQENPASITWWIAGATEKIAPAALPPADPDAPLHLDAARSEYAPFQIVLNTGDQAIPAAAVSIDAPGEWFDVALFQEQYLDLPIVPEPEIFSLARLKAPALPDGLRPVTSLDLPAESVSAAWVDLYVRPDTPPGDYSLTIKLNGAEARTVQITVYPVDLPDSAALSVIIPVGEPDWTIPFYGGSDPQGFLRAMNQLLLDHDLVPGTFAAQPRVTAEGWDFSALDAELDALPAGALFYAPGPYDAETGQFRLLDDNGAPYTATNFEDPRFAGQVDAYFQALAAYLAAQGRLDGALIYPLDESRWVGDEPLHGGPAGFRRLAEWTAAARRAGLHVQASGVTPVPPGPPARGWIAPQQVADDLHVHVDWYDAAPDLFAAWSKGAGRSASLYLNEYGDLIDMPAAIQRGLLWHAYARGVREVAGYAALEWVDANYDLVDPWTAPEQLYPQSGYGGGALIWPGPLPSLRLKLLREGVEDARLLDLYAQATSPDEARRFAACLTPGALADQNPPADLWDRAHAELLIALAEGGTVGEELCLTPPTFTRQRVIIDFDQHHGDLGEWEFSGAQGALVANGSDQNMALTVRFSGSAPEAGLWLGAQNWSRWKALQVEVTNQSPYFTMLDVGLRDSQEGFILLRNGAILLGPNAQRTLTLPLVAPLNADAFDWTSVDYLSLQVNTTTEQTDGFGVTQTYPLGPRTLIFDHFTLVR